jgi:hypothetical protein
VSKLSDYLNAHVPAGWSKMQVVAALEGKVDRATVYRYLSGRHPRRPSEPVLEAFASGLPGISMTELRAVAGTSVGEEEPWIPTKEANRLNHGQRMALDAFIRATVGARDESGTVQLIEELLAARQEPKRQLQAETRDELEIYVEQLYASGRERLADRLADRLPASRAISSASQTAKRSSKE